MANMFQEWMLKVGKGFIAKKAARLRMKDKKTGKHPHNRSHDPAYISQLRNFNVKVKG